MDFVLISLSLSPPPQKKKKSRQGAKPYFEGDGTVTSISLLALVTCFSKIMYAFSGLDLFCICIPVLLVVSAILYYIFCSDAFHHIHSSHFVSVTLNTHLWNIISFLYEFLSFHVDRASETGDLISTFCILDYTSFLTCSPKYFEQLHQFVIFLNIILEIHADFVYWYTVGCVTF